MKMEKVVLQPQAPMMVVVVRVALLLLLLLSLLWWLRVLREVYERRPGRDAIAEERSLSGEPKPRAFLASGASWGSQGTNGGRTPTSPPSSSTPP